MKTIALIIVAWWLAWNYGWMLDREPRIMRPVRDYITCTRSMFGINDFLITGPCAAGIVYKME